MFKAIANRPVLIIVLIIAGFILGLAVSVVRETGTNTTATAEPNVTATATQTVTAEPEPAETVTKTVTKSKTVTKTPKACRTALKLADELDEQHNKLHRTSGSAVTYAQQGDYDGLDEATRLAERFIEDIKETRTKYVEAATECKEK